MRHRPRAGQVLRWCTGSRRSRPRDDDGERLVALGGRTRARRASNGPRWPCRYRTDELGALRGRRRSTRTACRECTIADSPPGAPGLTRRRTVRGTVFESSAAAARGIAAHVDQPEVVDVGAGDVAGERRPQQVPEVPSLAPPPPARQRRSRSGGCRAQPIASAVKAAVGRAQRRTGAVSCAAPRYRSSPTGRRRRRRPGRARMRAWTSSGDLYVGGQHHQRRPGPRPSGRGACRRC